jgi:two-component system alkaline phosphatase synthesis response regulator PhoP
MRKRILIVEDNEELLELLSLSLKCEGFSISTAKSGIEAVKKARTSPPDVILLDLMLPEMDGFGVCETLRRQAATAGIPILILSGATGEFTRTAGLESGGTDFIAKPASPAELASRIRRFLEPTVTPLTDSQPTAVAGK